MRQDVKTVLEIYGQPKVWQDCLDMLENFDLTSLVQGKDPRQTEWVFVGCGTSYYLAQAAAASFTTLLSVKTRAVPASEILLFPSLVFPDDTSNYFPVLISRSGHTSEVLHVAEYLQGRSMEFLAVTCDGRELERLSPRTLKLPVIEESTVMTSSFTSMLMALQYLAASIAGDDAFLFALRTLPEHTERLLKIYGPRIEQFAKQDFEDFAFLGQGPLYAIASETALKVMESSSSYAQYFHTLEFRHGPKSVVDGKAMVGGLISESGYESEISVLVEMKELGGTIFAVANSASETLRETADLLIELSLPVPELARIIVYVLWGQLLGSYRGLEKGLDPDNPKNLNRVVTI
ncbi:SIS domain-containing protein [Terriglobus saanensis]|uniref:Glutamine--fructose-6-phosphate transaminase (Isomerizing) n=1 Tax=Terriglobus saanensis (strain ATCC BAA-1853 / DSM 23119 / SP1PR4) TaxID=401053 RepID=E8V0X5_TERSS|nr:SIS domain-containing protein [Terriglobus saanensis]ADV82266.1 Glutamine--fructose-6-phosphate transaminase (isomerizing) [Terriglobus saanensis SP1PR4]